MEISQLRRHRHDPEVLLDQGPLGAVPPGRSNRTITRYRSLPGGSPRAHPAGRLRDHPDAGGVSGDDDARRLPGGHVSAVESAELARRRGVREGEQAQSPTRMSASKARRRRVVLPATAPVWVGLGPDRPELPCGGKLLDAHDVPARHLLGPTIDLHHQSLLPSRHQMTRALIEAPGRGVRVVVLLPGAIDNNIVRQASRSKFGELLKAGVEIYEYQAGLLHAQVMTVDGIWATRSSRRARPGILQPAAGG